MVRVIYAHPVVVDQVRYFRFAGLSTDDKPTEEVATGSEFTEVDTGDRYEYNETSGSWVLQPSEGGGGGTTNYNQLSNKPKINDVELSGNKSAADLGIESVDVQINGTSIVDDGVANIPLAGDTPGAVMVVSGYGISKNSSGRLYVAAASDANIKTGAETFSPIVPVRQHLAAFYGLAKAAGADMKDVSGATVGTYPAAQKTAIQTMLGVEQGVCFVETVSGTTPSITAEANVRYICGEVSTISITPPQTGTVIVRFESGSTPAVLTLPSTVLFPDGLDLTTLEANTIYEIMITDGIYGGVVTWQE